MLTEVGLVINIFSQSVVHQSCGVSRGYLLVNCTIKWLVHSNIKFDSTCNYKVPGVQYNL